MREDDCVAFCGRAARPQTSHTPSRTWQADARCDAVLCCAVRCDAMTNVAFGLFLLSLDCLCSLRLCDLEADEDEQDGAREGHKDVRHEQGL